MTDGELEAEGGEHMNEDNGTHRQDGDAERDGWLPEGVTALDEDARIEEFGALDPDLDEDDDEDLEFEESEAPWSPVPVQAARQFLKEHPEAKLDLIFPEAYAEDRTAKIKDIITAEGTGMLSHHRATEMVAQEFGFEQFDYHAEMEQIRLERKKYGDILGAGDELAARVGKADDEEAPAYDSAPERAEFRKRQKEREVVFVERDPGTHRLSSATAVPAPEGVDLEQFIREKRQELQRRREQEQPAHAAEGSGPNTADVLAEGRAQAARLPGAPKPKFTKDEVNYRFSSATEQLSRGKPVTACGVCLHFEFWSPSQPATCEIVEGKVAGTDVCSKFKRRAGL